MRLPIPEGFSGWWDECHLPQEALTIRLTWRSGAEFTLGELNPVLGAFRFSPNPDKFTGEGAERVGRMVGKALTRAGWLRPHLDPEALLRLIVVRSEPSRVEFILDTNALVEGIGHWLADHFADRCDLVVTAVTLRELQDLKGQARFNEKVPKEDNQAENRAKMLGARQAYLSANRFREQVGYKRILWRELELDDTALLLSRGSADTKSSESDTLLLRAVRRSIHDRVNKLERFFVTGDNALARRAATELPEGSLIAAQVREVRAGDVLFPCSWWPGPDQGFRVSRHPARLIWELLCIGDQVKLEAHDGKTWAFRAFDNPMWPSDYLKPWIDVAEPALEDVHGGGPGELIARSLSEADNSVTAENRAAPDTRQEAPGSIWRVPSKNMLKLDRNLRLSAKTTLDVLGTLVASEKNEVHLPQGIADEKARRHLCAFLKELDLADVDLNSWVARRLSRHEDLVAAWCSNDHDALFDLLRGWLPLEEWATNKNPPQRPEKTQGSARALAALLSQGLYIDQQWLPGGSRPGLTEMRQAILDAVPRGPEPAIPVYTLLVDVFLRRLGVAPARIVHAWDKLWSMGVFDGFEPREGGTSSGQRFQEIARLTEGGWDRERIDLEAIDGTRDLLYRRTS